MMQQHMMEPAQARTKLDELKSRLSGVQGVSGSILSWIQMFLLPFLQMFGGMIHYDALYDVITSAIGSAVSSGSNIPKAILDAIKSNLGRIFGAVSASQVSQAERAPHLAATKGGGQGGGQDDVHAAANVLLEAEKIRLENNPELSGAQQHTKQQDHSDSGKKKK